jgi:NADH-quinone oxidoreductase subunit L
MAHAFFKALLFLGAGNVMHAMHDELDPFKMGALGKTMKGTMILMTLASVALAGIFPLAGFFSKDLILEVAFIDHHFIIYSVLLVTAGLTAFYSFRIIALIFHGEDRHTALGHHPHEAYKFMLVAMSPLLVLAIIAGFMLKMPYFEMVTQLLPATEYHVHSATTYWIMTIGTQLFVILSIFFAYKKYMAPGIKIPDGTSAMENSFKYKLLINQYYIPYFYEEYLVKPYRELSTVFWKQIDMKVVDATVDGIANILLATGENTRAMQSGNLSTMLRWMVAGLIVLLSLAVVFGLAVKYLDEIKMCLSSLGV